MKKSLVVAISVLTAGLAMTAATPASARVNWSVNVGVGGYGYYPPPVVYAPPAYYPPPVVYAPAPVYGQPVYQQPAYAPPVYVQPAQYYSPPVYIQHRPGPYYVAPPGYRSYQRGYREYPDYYRR